MANDIIDINVIQTVETVEITVTPNLTTVNINQITGGGGGGGGGVTNLSTTQTATNFSINSDTGDDAIVPLGNGTEAGATINDYTTTEKTKLAGIATGAEVNVNADWDATTGDAQILNKPIIPSISGLATVIYVDSQDALKVDKITGKGLSTEDYTTIEKTKLSGIATGAEVNVNADWDATTGDAQILNKPIIPSTTNLVPYTGAISDVNLGEYGIQLGNLEFDNTPTNIPTSVGSMYYNDTDGTLDLILKGGNVKLQIGQESVVRVVNKTATNITLLESNYQAVRVTGAQGQRMKVDLAQATTDGLSAETIGLVTETIANNQEGFVTTSGLVRNINTTGSLQSETWADGDVLYLSPTVAGSITKVKPIAPNHLIVIGYVISAHATQGTIFVKVDNGYELDELHNVNITSEANEDFLQYESATQLWKNKALTGTLIKSKLGITTLSGDNTGDQNLSGYALLASPTFSGTPSLPTGTIAVTQTSGDNTTKIATTAFVASALSAGLGVTVSPQDTFSTANIATVTASQYNAFVIAGTVSATTLYFITA
jgi:Cu/Ag efflux protein CusF